MINILIEELMNRYQLNGDFTFRNGPAQTAVFNLNVVSNGVPVNKPGLYFIYAPYSQLIENFEFLTHTINAQLYILVYVGKAGMKKNWQLNNLQMLHGRINNVGTDDIKRAIIWTEFMNAKGINQLLFRWCVTSNPLNPQSYDNCFLIEQGFCNIWTAIPQFKPELNSI
jgi:hypothetical protein